MPNLPDLVWLLIGGVAAWAAVAAVDALCTRMRREMTVHDLAVQTMRLKIANEARLDRIRRGEGSS